ncbi:cation:proton antiporter [candidate division WOR-3 bacterium]|nr:cation:proton antiporter [candidate division WOR-3 bacterium]
MNSYGLHILTIGLLILAGNLGGRIARRLRISEIIGQIMGGIVIGPLAILVLRNISDDVAIIYSREFISFQFVIFAFLSLIAFGIGEELHFTRLKKIFKRVFWVSIANVALTFTLVFLAFLFYGKIVQESGIDLLLSLLIASIAIAQSPAIIFAIMNRYEIEGDIRNIIGNIMAIVDLFAIFIFSVLIQIKTQTGTDISVLKTTKDIGLAFLIGMAAFVFLWILIHGISKDEKKRKADFFMLKLLTEHPAPSMEMFLTVAGIVTVITGISILLHLPFLIAVLVAGALIANFSGSLIFDSMKIENIMPAFNLLFFALIGAEIDFSKFSTPILVPIMIYVIIRALSQYTSVKIVLKIMKNEPKIVNCVPPLMIPQDGVAAVEAAFLVSVLGSPGQTVADIVIPSLVIFSVFGVFLTERYIKKWQNWVIGEAEVVKGEKILPKRHRFNRDDIAYVDLEDENDRKGTIEALAIEGEKRGFFPDKNAVIDASNIRETLQETILMEGIVLPHCRLRAMKKPKIVFGISSKGVMWGKKAHRANIIILLISPTVMPELHLGALSYIAFTCKETMGFKGMGPEEIKNAMTSLPAVAT